MQREGSAHVTPSRGAGSNGRPARGDKAGCVGGAHALAETGEPVVAATPVVIVRGPVWQLLGEAVVDEPFERPVQRRTIPFEDSSTACMMA